MPGCRDSLGAVSSNIKFYMVRKYICFIFFFSDPVKQYTPCYIFLDSPCHALSNSSRHVMFWVWCSGDISGCDRSHPCIVYHSTRL